MTQRPTRFSSLSASSGPPPTPSLSVYGRPGDDDPVVILGVTSSTVQGDAAFKTTIRRYLTCSASAGTARDTIVVALCQLTLWSYAFAWLLLLVLVGIVLVSAAVVFDPKNGRDACIAIFFFAPQVVSAVLAVSAIHLRTFSLGSLDPPISLGAAGPTHLRTRAAPDAFFHVAANTHAPSVRMSRADHPGAPDLSLLEMDSGTTWPSWWPRLLCYCVCAIASLLFLVLVPVLGWMDDLKDAAVSVYFTLLALVAVVLFLYLCIIVSYAVSAYSYTRRLLSKGLAPL